ncbi:Hypothetical predicted protein, partial [Marmota monax]
QKGNQSSSPTPSRSLTTRPRGTPESTNAASCSGARPLCTVSPWWLLPRCLRGPPLHD